MTRKYVERILDERESFLAKVAEWEAAKARTAARVEVTPA